MNASIERISGHLLTQALTSKGYGVVPAEAGGRILPVVDPDPRRLVHIDCRLDCSIAAELRNTFFLTRSRGPSAQRSDRENAFSKRVASHAAPPLQVSDFREFVEGPLFWVVSRLDGGRFYYWSSPRSYSAQNPDAYYHATIARSVLGKGMDIGGPLDCPALLISCGPNEVDDLLFLSSASTYWDTVCDFYFSDEAMEYVYVVDHSDHVWVHAARPDSRDKLVTELRSDPLRFEDASGFLDDSEC